MGERRQLLAERRSERVAENLQRAYREPNDEAGKERLTGLHADLQQIERTGAPSLQEGLIETLTLHLLLCASYNPAYLKDNLAGRIF